MKITPTVVKAALIGFATAVAWFFGGDTLATLIQTIGAQIPA